MPTPKLNLAYKYLTAPEVQKELGLSRYQLLYRIQLGILPKPTFVDTTSVRYFDEDWVKIARIILNNAVNHKGGKNESSSA